VLVRMKERRDFGPEFGRIPIITSNEGTQVLLSDIARITDGFEDTDSYATYNGYPAILIEVYRVGDQTPIAVSEAVHEKLVEINADLPPQIFLDARNDRSDIYRQRMDLMLKNGLYGAGAGLHPAGGFSGTPPGLLGKPRDSHFHSRFTLLHPHGRCEHQYHLHVCVYYHSGHRRG
jgi:hypothetical protein